MGRQIHREGPRICEKSKIKLCNNIIELGERFRKTFAI